MPEYCLSCDYKDEIEAMIEPVILDVRGEPIEVTKEFYKCPACGDSFISSRGHDMFNEAYREYRRRHDMLQPESIRKLRRQYGFTQYEFSTLLGWETSTLSRYENGALQEESQDTLLKFVMEPVNLLQLIERKPSRLSEEKRLRLIEQLSSAQSLAKYLEHLYAKYWGNDAPDKFSGNKKLDLEKWFNVVLFFCGGGGQLRTKLNKLLFYADFKHFKEYLASITGTRYIHYRHGPVSQNYENFFAALILEERLCVEEVIFGDFVGENCVSQQEPNFALFSDSEIKVLTEVKEYFNGNSARKISQLSHMETGYLATKAHDFISYEYAKFLKI